MRAGNNELLEDDGGRRASAPCDDRLQEPANLGLANGQKRNSPLDPETAGGRAGAGKPLDDPVRSRPFA